MKKQKEAGSLTVEAAIFLMLFIVFFVSLMNIVDIVRAQILIQNGIMQTAKELSQYSYVLTKTGIVESSNQNYETVKAVRSDIDSVANDITEISGAIGNIQNSGDIGSSVQTIINSSNSMSGVLDSYIENPESILAAAIAVGRDRLEAFAKTAVISSITKSRLKTHLSVNGVDPDERLKKLGIEAGLDGLDFSESKWFDEGNQDIYIVCKYTIQLKYMFLEKDCSFKVCAATRIW